MIENLLGSSFTSGIAIALYALSGFLGIFLFFRAGRHELIDKEILFDAALIGAIGALILGRLVDFLTRYQFYNFSPKKLIFFNVFFGFDWYGAFLGAALLSGLYLKRKKQKTLFIFDLAAAPIVFGAMFVYLINYLLSYKLISIFYFTLLLIFFWILKRLAKTKRFEGFFVSITLTCAGLLNIIAYPLNEKRQMFGTVDYQVLMSLLTITVGVILFYKFSKKNIRSDIKNFGAYVLLSIFKVKRVLFSMHEANLVARSIILAPYYLAKLTANLVKLLGREIYTSMLDLIHVFGVRK